ncbi:hypothetical protein HanRHA438_Chr10g0466701 [Helianthus annuus]|nr:hypothetical protein HanRHA438_Chr10g0466701 [Helianthus annuus]
MEGWIQTCFSSSTLTLNRPFKIDFSLNQPLQIINGEKFSLWFEKISIESWRWSVLPIFR